MSLLSSTHPTSDSGLAVSLHPLVLLAISDYITRHTLRHQPRPIVGALLGQQNGRSITLEYAYECETIQSPSPFSSSNSGEDAILLHEAWFKDRLQQYKDVHKAPALELVGWFTTAPVTGPEAAQLPIHQQILQTYNETAVLLAFHPTNIIEGADVGGKLPLTIYESVFESTDGATNQAGAMDVDTEGGRENVNTGLDLRFRELPYSVETGEAEMIGVDFVARGGGNATAVDAGATKSTGKGKANQVPGDPKSPKESKAIEDSLSAEDEEIIASLTARANAVHMLHTRISLLKSYLTSLPPSYLTHPPAATTLPPSSQQQQIDHPLLRSISALLSRLPLLLPSTADSLSSFQSQTLAEKSDVELVSLLGTLGRSVKDAREMGRKFDVVNGARVQARKSGGGSGFNGAGGIDLMGSNELMKGGDLWGMRGGLGNGSL